MIQPIVFDDSKIFTLSDALYVPRKAPFRDGRVPNGQGSEGDEEGNG
jgi:hypothetical protein